MPRNAGVPPARRADRMSALHTVQLRRDWYATADRTTTNGRATDICERLPNTKTPGKPATTTYSHRLPGGKHFKSDNKAAEAFQAHPARPRLLGLTSSRSPVIGRLSVGVRLRPNPTWHRRDQIRASGKSDKRVPQSVHRSRGPSQRKRSPWPPTYRCPWILIEQSGPGGQWGREQVL